MTGCRADSKHNWLGLTGPGGSHENKVAEKTASACPAASERYKKPVVARSFELILAESNENEPAEVDTGRGRLIAGRGWPEKIRYFAPVGVKHKTLYLKGPFERCGSTDGYFRTWDLDSALAGIADPAIFLGNVVVLPAALTITPPWQQQISRSIFPVVEPMYELPGPASGMTQNENQSRVNY